MERGSLARRLRTGFAAAWMLCAVIGLPAIAPAAHAQSAAPAMIAEAADLLNNIRHRLDNCGDEGMLGDAGMRKVSTAPVRSRPNLSYNPRLATVAANHGRAMAEQQFFDHVDMNGKTVGHRATESGYRWRLVGENLAAGHDTIGEAMRGWLLSTSHCRNLIDERFTEFGLAKVSAKDPQDPYGTYWVLVLGRPSGTVDVAAR